MSEYLYENTDAAASLSPLYILDGDENYFKRKAVDSIVRKVLGGTKSPFNFQEILPGNYEGPQTLETHLCQAGLFSKRVVLINYFDDFSDKEKKEIVEVLSRGRFVTPSTDTVVVLQTEKKLVTFGKGAWTRDFTKLTSKPFTAYYIAYPPLPDKLLEWTVSYLKKNGRSIAKDAAQYILKSTDATLTAVKGELDKIILYTHGKDHIDLSDIDDGVGDYKAVTVFDFCDHALFSKKKEALLCLRKIAEESSGGWDLYMLQMLWRTYKRNVEIKTQMDRLKMDDAAVKKSLNVPFFRKDEVLKGIKKLTLQNLKDQMNGLFELECTIKGEASSQFLKRYAFEKFIFELPVIMN